MITRLDKWGNSLAIRIPKAFVEELDLTPKSEIEITQEHGVLTLTPIRGPEYSLEELLAQITPENLHGETNTGTAVGNEVW